MIQNIKNKWLRRAVVVLSAIPATAIMVGLWLIAGLTGFYSALKAIAKEYGPRWVETVIAAWKGDEFQQGNTQQ